MYLIIAEKELQAKKLAAPFKSKSKGDCIEVEPCDELPKGARIVWCSGHLCELKEPKQYDDSFSNWELGDLPIIPKQMEFKVGSGRKNKLFNVIKKYIHDSSTSLLVNGGDSGREGQLIVDLVITLAGGSNKPAKRLWITSLTKDGVKKGFKNLHDNKRYHPLYLEAKTRAQADWLVGINATRCLTLLMNEKGASGTFKVGRVKSPIMTIIYERELQIENFISEPFWDVVATFNIEGYTYEGKWFNDDMSHLMHLSHAKLIEEQVKDKPCEVVLSEKEDDKKRPPRFFNTSTLLTKLNKKYQYSTQKGTKLLQELYQKGFLTYPRVKPEVVTEGEAKEFPTILKEIAKIPAYSDLVPEEIRELITDKRYVDASKVDDGHYAIIPTEVVPDLNELSKDEANVYDLVVRRLIAAHYPDALYEKRKVITAVDGFTFLTKHTSIIDMGWRFVFEEEKEPTDSEPVPDMKPGALGLTEEVDLDENETKPIPRFTEGDLLTVMANAAHYIDDTARKDYSKQELSLGTDATRANIVKELIECSYITVEKNLVHITPKGRILVNALQSSEGILSSPLLTANWERALLQIGEGKRDHTQFLNTTRVMVDKVIREMKETSSRWEFEEEIQEQKESESIGHCLECGSELVERQKFYGCSAYKQSGCNFKVFKVVASKKVPIKELRKLLEKGTTSKLKGFKNKEKKPFDAYLTWNSNSKKVEFKR